MIGINTIVGTAVGKSFNITGMLSGYWKPPSLVYLDDNKVLPKPLLTGQTTKVGVVLSWNAVGDVCGVWPPGASCSTSSYSFLHPAMTTAGKHVISISDGCSFVSQNYIVASADGTKVALPSDPPIIDAAGSSWSLKLSNNASTGNQIAVNGVVDGTTSTVTLLYYHSSKVYQCNKFNAWWYKASPGDSWHSCTSPLPVAKAGEGHVPTTS